MSATSRRVPIVLALSMFVMGAAGLVYEYLLSVLGNHLMGSSHEQLFVVMGIMLFAMGVSAAWQGRIQGPLIDRFLWLQLGLGLFGGTAVLVSYTAFVHLPNYEVVHYGLAFVVGALVGLEIPLLLRINQEHGKNLRVNLSQILCMDYVGALAGALLFAYVLLGNYTLERIGLALGVVNTSLALVGVALFRTLARHPRRVAIAGIAQIGLLGLAAWQSPQWMAGLEQRCYENPIVFAETTPYQRIVMTRRGEELNLYLNGNLQFSSVDEAIYHEMLVHPVMALAKRRERVLVLGGGDGLAVREVLRWPDVRAVDLVDIDPRMLELAATHPELVRLNAGSLGDARVDASGGSGVSEGDPRFIEQPSRLTRTFQDDSVYRTAEVRSLALDADLFVRSLGRDYDVAILDFPDPSRLELAKLFSVEFYQALAGRLTPEAPIVVQSSSPWETRRAYLVIGETLRAAGLNTLPFHEHVPSFGEWGYWMAWRVGPTPDERKKVIAQGVDLGPISPTYVTPGNVSAAFEWGRGWLTIDDTIQPSTRMRPVIVEAYRKGRS